MIKSKMRLGTLQTELLHLLGVRAFTQGALEYRELDDNFIPVSNFVMKNDVPFFAAILQRTHREVRDTLIDLVILNHILVRMGRLPKIQTSQTGYVFTTSGLQLFNSISKETFETIFKQIKQMEKQQMKIKKKKTVNAVTKKEKSDAESTATTALKKKKKKTSVAKEEPKPKKKAKKKATATEVPTSKKKKKVAAVKEEIKPKKKTKKKIATKIVAKKEKNVAVKKTKMSTKECVFEWLDKMSAKKKKLPTVTALQKRFERKAGSATLRVYHSNWKSERGY